MQLANIFFHGFVYCFSFGLFAGCFDCLSQQIFVEIKRDSHH